MNDERKNTEFECQGIFEYDVSRIAQCVHSIKRKNTVFFSLFTRTKARERIKNKT